MKKNIILIVITILFLSCSDNEIIPEVIIPEQSTPTTRSVGDGKYDALGFGYNCFYSNFSNPLYAKAQVIDLQKLEAGIGTDQLTGKKFIFNPSKIIEAQLHGLTESRTAYGTSIEKLTEDMRFYIHTSLDQKKIIKLFSLDIESTITNSSNYQELNSFYKVDALKATRRLTLPYTNPAQLKYFLTDEFLFDLKNLSGKDIVNKYGTHVMTDILLGGNFSALYTGKYKSSGSTSGKEFKTSASFLMSSIKGETKFDKTTFKSFTNVNVYIKTQGGRNAVSTIINQTGDGTLGNFSIDYNSWINSVDINSESLIGIGNPDTEIYFISSFIEHPFIRMGIEEALLSKESGCFTLSKPNNKEECYLCKRMDQDYKKYGLIVPKEYPSGATVQTSVAMQYEKAGKHFRLKYPYGIIDPQPINKYLSRSFDLVPFQNSDTQLWNIYVNDKNNSEILLQNVATGLYLSAKDGEFHNKPNKEEIQDFYLKFSIM